MSIAIITGASSGMGQEFALQMNNYADIDEMWLIARREDRLNDLAAKLNKKTRVFPLDLTKESSYAAISAALSETQPDIKYLVNCAGYAKFGSHDQIATSDAIGMIDLNAKALTVINQACVPYMKKGSRIVNLVSISAYMPLENLAVYAASKAYALSYSYALGAELKNKGIKVTAVCPGWVSTEFFDRADNGENAKHPKKFAHVSTAQKVVKKALKAVKRGAPVSIYGTYWKMMHVISKITPRKCQQAIWHGMQRKEKK